MFKFFTDQKKRMGAKSKILRWVIGPIVGLIMVFLAYVVVSYIHYKIFGKAKSENVDPVKIITVPFKRP